jgi:hypothetical protein
MRTLTTAVISLGVGLVLGWVARQPAEPVPEIVLRTIRQPIRVEVPAACADPVTTACLDQDRVALALIGFPEDVPLAPPATEAACRARIALATALATARQLDQVGRPEPFPADLPEKYREETIRAVTERMVESCPELGLDLRKVDCAEFPCLALFVQPADREGPAACPAWREVWGVGQMGSNDTLIGPDGQELAYALMGPVLPEEFFPHRPEKLPGGQIAWSNGMKRMMQRGQEARDEVIAELGARERTEAEQRDEQRRHLQEAADEGDEDAAQMLEMLEQHRASEDAR